VTLPQRADGQWVEDTPGRCPNGHALGPGTTIVNFTHCDCTEGLMGHRTWTCRAVVGERECAAIYYSEPCAFHPDIPVHR
jgi:hypothetical protein